jgi:hypothetical protein
MLATSIQRRVRAILFDGEHAHRRGDLEAAQLPRAVEVPFQCRNELVVVDGWRHHLEAQVRLVAVLEAFWLAKAAAEFGT